MGRFGRLPVALPEGVKAGIDKAKVTITGPKGSLEVMYPSLVTVSEVDGELVVKTNKESKQAYSTQGSIKSHIANMVHGVTEGWSKTLEINGAGYRAEVRGKDLVLTIGYSHPVIITAPEGVTFNVEKSLVTVSGADKSAVGEVSARIRASRPPEPYKGAGIKYQDEIIRRKAGKQAAKGA